MQPDRRIKFDSTRRKMCLDCEVRPAVFMHDGKCKADTEHTLCPKCYKSLSDQVRAKVGRAK